jgi:hypothetical protein
VPNERAPSDWSADELAGIAAELGAEGAEALDDLPLADRIAAWLDVVESLLDPASSERQALLPDLLASSRLSPEGLSEALEVVLGGVRRGGVEALLARLPRRGSTRPRGFAGVVLAANVPALAVQMTLPALLLGRPLLLRSSAREPHFAPALVDALAAREPELGVALAAVHWPSDDEALELAAFGAAERVVAYGGADATAALAARLGDRLVALGPKASVALVAGAYDPLSVARGLARDVALLDQRGCLSVQAVYVVGEERRARELGEALAYALEIEHRRLPPGPLEPATAAAVQQLRAEADLTGRRIDGLELGAGTVLLEPELRFRPVPGLRTVHVHPAPTLEAIAEALAPARPILQGAATAGDALAPGDFSFTGVFASLAFSRVAPAGRLQHASAGWASGGIDPIAALAGELQPS